MNRFRKSFYFLAVVVSFPCGFFLAVNIINARPIGSTVFGAMLAMWWVLYWLLSVNKRYAFQLALAAVLLFWVPLLFQFIGRIMFVVENDSLEGPDGHGSPLAFFINLVFEQFFFIPLSMALASALVGLVKGDLNLFRRVQLEA